MVTYLVVRSGPQAGTQFPLSTARPTHIGRGESCDVLLADPVSSRFHAVIYFEDGNWQLRDTGSRNGTLVNGQKTDHAMLLLDSTITIGGTELVLAEPDEDAIGDASLPTIMLDRDIRGSDFLEALIPRDKTRDSAFVGQLIDLYTLSMQLMRTDGADEVIDLVIRLLRNRTGADIVAVSFDTGDGRLATQRSEPSAAADSLRLDRRLAKKVMRDGEALWVKEAEHQTGIAPTWSDAILVPLTEDDHVFGLLHLYRTQTRFVSDHFELAVSASRLLGVAFNRATKAASLRANSQRAADRNGESGQIIGNSAPIRRLKEKISRVGRASGSVLIRGESGVGKELVAQAVHQASLRRERPMITVNCAAIPRDLVESQLFGHKKGSFTGADADHTGWFQQAHAGTLFLDEVGELTLEAQAKLLRILEGHPFLPVGGTQQILVDVRVIAATNRDLAEFVKERKFREDLYYRLSVFELLVPPLRDREEDIDLLIQHFFEHFRVEHHRLNLSLSKAARERLLSYPWPGNVRQLRNVIDSAVVMADEPEILPGDLGLHETQAVEPDTLRIDEWERRLITRALKRTGGSIPEASELLGSAARPPTANWPSMASTANLTDAKPLAIISAVGSRGDVNPLVAIGKQLKQQHGFDVVVSLAENYCHVAEAAGLIAEPTISRAEFQQMVEDPLVWRPLTGVQRILQGAVSRFLRPHWALIERYHRPGRTVLVQHPLDFASRIYRDFDPSTPLCSVQLSPALVRDPQQPPRLSPWWFEPRRPAWLMRLAYWAVDHLIADRWLLPSINPLRHEVGLPPIHRALDRWWTSPDQVLGMFPAWFGYPKPYVDGNWLACGFPRVDADKPVSGSAEAYQGQRATLSPHDLATTCQEAIVFTPGTAQHHAVRWFEWAADATAGLGRRVIFASSHPDQLPQRLPSHVTALGYIDFNTVLPQAALLVHHGGIGTTAAALRAGCPQWICPSAFDQFHHADLVQQLGVGKAFSSGPTAKPPCSAGDFNQQLKQLLSDKQLRQTARSLACNQLNIGSDYQGHVVAAQRIASWIR